MHDATTTAAPRWADRDDRFVRAAEAGARTGLAADAGAMVAIVLAEQPGALADDLTETVDLAAFTGGPVELRWTNAEVLERGAGLA